MSNEVSVTVVGRDRMSPELAKARENAEGFGASLRRVGEIAGGVFAAQVLQKGLGQLKDFIGDGIAAAADLEQSIGGVEAVFGDSAARILEFGKTADQTLGLSKNSFNELAAPLGAMLKSAGFEMDEVTKRTLDLTQKGADLAATFGGPVDDAIGAISSLMRGESNPIERYGVAIKQSDVNLRALANTGKTATAELTAQELAVARLDLLFEQTTASVGQFAREEDTAAGKAERLRAAQENAAASLGEKLLPIQVKVTEAKLAFVRLLSERVIPVVGEIARLIGEVFGPTVRRLGDFIGNVRRPFGDFIGDIQWVIQNGTGFNEKLSSGVWADLAEKIGSVVITLRDFIGDIQWVIQNGTGFNEKLTSGVWADLAEAIGGAVIWIREQFIPALQELGQYLMDRIVPAVQQLRERIVQEFKALQAYWTTDLRPAVIIIARVIRDAVAEIVAFVRRHWPQIEATIRPVIETVVTIIDTAFEAIKRIIAIALDIIQGDWKGAWDNLKALVGTVIEGIKETLRGLLDFIRELGTLLFNVAKDLGADIVRGIVEGIKSLGSAIGNALKDAMPDSISLPGGASIPIDPRKWFGGGDDPEGRAVGGPVLANTPYLVGEHGPEVYVPSTSGAIIPNHRLGAASGDGTPQVNFYGPVTIEAQDRDRAMRSARDISYGLSAALRARGAA